MFVQVWVLDSAVGKAKPGVEEPTGGQLQMLIYSGGLADHLSYLQYLGVLVACPLDRLEWRRKAGSVQIKLQALDCGMVADDDEMKTTIFFSTVADVHRSSVSERATHRMSPDPDDAFS